MGQCNSCHTMALSTSPFISEYMASTQSGHVVAEGAEGGAHGGPRSLNDLHVHSSRWTDMPAG